MSSPGWYPDPAGTDLLRYFDGENWTNEMMPLDMGQAGENNFNHDTFQSPILPKEENISDIWAQEKESDENLSLLFNQNPNDRNVSSYNIFETPKEELPNERESKRGRKVRASKRNSSGNGFREIPRGSGGVSRSSGGRAKKLVFPFVLLMVIFICYGAFKGMHQSSKIKINSFNPTITNKPVTQSDSSNTTIQNNTKTQSDKSSIKKSSSQASSSQASSSQASNQKIKSKAKLSTQLDKKIGSSTRTKVSTVKKLPQSSNKINSGELINLLSKSFSQFNSEHLNQGVKIQHSTSKASLTVDLNPDGTAYLSGAGGSGYQSGDYLYLSMSLFAKVESDSGTKALYENGNFQFIKTKISQTSIGNTLFSGDFFDGSDLYKEWNYVKMNITDILDKEVDGQKVITVLGRDGSDTMRVFLSKKMEIESVIINQGASNQTVIKVLGSGSKSISLPSTGILTI